MQDKAQATGVYRPQSNLLPMLKLTALFVALTASLLAAAPSSTVSEGVIAAPVDQVWAAWTTTEGLKAWVAPHADITLELDGRMRTNYSPEGRLGDAGTIENRILAFEPRRMLSIRVAKPPENFPFRERVGEMWTILYFEPTADGKTKLRIVGLGFGADETAQKMRAFFQAGNDYTLTMLQKRFSQ